MKEQRPDDEEKLYIEILKKTKEELEIEKEELERERISKKKN